MALELGLDRKQVAAFKALVERWTGDPVRFKFFVTLALLAITVFAIEMPLAGRLALARTRLAEAKQQAALAHEVRGYTEQVGYYEPHVAVSPDLVNWQNYVLEKLAYSTTTLISLEPKSADSKGIFQVVQMELVARGTSYREFVDFVDRLERGERIVRVEKLRLEKHQTSIYLTCVIKGLIKSSAKAAEAGAAEGDAAAGADGEPGAGDEADSGGEAGADAETGSDAEAGTHAATRTEEDAGAAAGTGGGTAAANAANAEDEDEPADAGEGDPPVIELLRRNIVIVALLLLAWFGYSDLDYEAKKATGATKSALRAIDPRDVDAREPDPALVLARDPYVTHEAGTSKPGPGHGGAGEEAGEEAGAEEHGAAGGRSSAGAATGSRSTRTTGSNAGAKPGARTAGAGSGAGASGGAAPGSVSAGTTKDPSQVHALLPGSAAWGSWTAARVRGVVAELAAAAVPPAPFALQLQSTLALPGGGQARINGQTLAVGQALAGADPACPPVLASVQGPLVVVRHRGRDYVLDLDHRPRLEVTGAAGAPASPSAGAGTGSAPKNAMSGPGSAPRAAPAKGPTAAPAAPAGGGAAPKKTTYKARGYPKKKP